MVTKKVQNSINNINYIIVNIDKALLHYSQGDVSISKRGSLHIGKVTMQRKGGDNGRKSANMIQFKLNPAELFYI